LATFSLYYTVKQLTDARTGLLTALLLGCHPFFFGPLGWDYGDGFGMAYYLFAMAMLTRALTAAIPSIWITLCGAAAAALFYTYPLWLLFMPFFAFYYAIPTWRSGRRSLWLAFPLFGWFFVLGFALATGLLALINHWAGGSYNFYHWSLSLMF